MSKTKREVVTYTCDICGAELKKAMSWQLSESMYLFSIKQAASKGGER